jgi:uncharacterized protein YjiS (DUF1127 family)
MSQVHALAASNCAAAGPSKTKSRVGLFALIALWRSRQQLAKLDETQLADIGISQASATNEAGRAPWDVPAHWRN